MALRDEVVDRLGEEYLVEITNFDAATETEDINETRLAKAIADAETLVRREAGLVEPTDTSTDEYGTFVALFVKAVRYQLLFFKEPETQGTRNALQEFRDQAERWRSRTTIPLLTDSPVDVSDEDVDDRRARFSPRHFNDFRIG